MERATAARVQLAAAAAAAAAASRTGALARRSRPASKLALLTAETPLPCFAASQAWYAISQVGCVKGA